MHEEQLYNKIKISRAIIIDLLRNQEPTDIKAKHIKDYDPPDALIKNKPKRKYIPDITVQLENNMHLYEIELGDDPDTEKWRMFDAFTKISGGKFFLVVPDTQKIEIKKALEETGISARILYFDPF
jgi:hypothetical protein